MVVNESDLGLVSMSFLDGCGGTPKIRRQVGNTSIEVTVSTLDEVHVEQRLRAPTLVKIDVEGAESRVLRGAHRVIGRHQPQILAEVHGVRCEKVKVANALANLGYEPMPSG